MNIILEACEVMRSHGITPERPDLIRANGKVCRFHAIGDGLGKKNGWCIIHCDSSRPLIVFGSWRTGEKYSIPLDSGVRLTQHELQRMTIAAQRAQLDREEELEAERTRIAMKARTLWDSFGPADPRHAYLERKYIGAYGVRQSGDKIAVPLRDESGQITSLQFISPDGKKRFLQGGRVQGCFHIIGKPSAKIIIAEGFATAATIHEDTGWQSIAAFSAGNLPTVAKIIRAKYHDAEIHIAADNDERADGSNRGREMAMEAAHAVQGFISMPPEPGTDFNDYANAGASLIEVWGENEDEDMRDADHDEHHQFAA